MRSLLKLSACPVLLALAPQASRDVFPERSATPDSLLAAALERLGGEERIANVAMWHVAGRGEENLSAELGGLAPNRPTWRPHEEKLGVDARTASVGWERRTPRNDHSLRWRRFVYRHDSSGVVVWTDSIAAMNASVTPSSRRRGLMRRVPHLLLMDVRRHAEWSELRERRELLGKPHHRIAARMPDAGELVLWLSVDSSILHRVDYRTHLPGRGDVTVAWEWPAWSSRADEPVLFAPVRHRITIGGEIYQRVSYTRFDGDSLAAASLLTAPPAFLARRHSSRRTPPPDDARLPVTGQVAPGVHILQTSGFNSLVVEFENFVVAMEAPEVAPGFESIPATRGPAAVAPAYLARTLEIAAGRPIRYAVVSHHHADHLGGLRAFASAGATLLVPPGTRDLVRSMLTAPHTIAPDDWTASSRPVRIEGVARERRITDGTRTLEIHNVGRNPHSEANLIAWLPDEGIIFQGDLFYYDQGQPFPPSGRETMNAFFARWLERRRLSPRAVYGVHGMGAASPAQLAEAVQPLP